MICLLVWGVGLMLHVLIGILHIFVRQRDEKVTLADWINAALIVANSCVAVIACGNLSKGHPTAQFNAHSKDAMAAWMTWMEIWPTLFMIAQVLAGANVVATGLLYLVIGRKKDTIIGVAGIVTAIAAVMFLGIASPRA